MGTYKYLEKSKNKKAAAVIIFASKGESIRFKRDKKKIMSEKKQKKHTVTK